MEEKIKHFFLGLVLLLVAGIFTSCLQRNVPQLLPEEILERSANRMASLRGFEFLIQRSGAPAFMDYDETIILSRVEGQYVSPDRVYATVRLVTPGLVSEVKVISIAGIQWDTNFLSGKWEPMDPAYNFNPSVLFNADTGIQTILAKDLTSPILLGIQELPEIPGKDLYVIQANLNGGQVYQITYGMIDNELLSITLWVDPVNFDLERFTLVDSADSVEEENTIWQLDFWNFNQAFEINIPTLDNP